jgi:glycosyltransferase involved in cell wall biosynthesis
MRKPKVLFIYPLRSSFVVYDIECLNKTANVLEFSFGIKKGIHILFRIIQLTLWLIKNCRSSKVIYIWFADFYGIIPAIFGSIFRIKTITFIGGYDAVAIPELRYGAHLNPIRSYMVRIVCNMSDVLIPSSEYTGQQLIQTLKSPKIKNKIKIAYPGINTKLFQINNIQKRDAVICISSGNSVNRMLLKGVDRFLELAKSMNKTKFYLVGIQDDAYEWAKLNASNNVELYSITSSEKLNELLNLSVAICLFSRNEAFGMVIIEGMLCGCVPIILDNTGTLEILSKPNAPGYIYSEFNSTKISNDIKTILDSQSLENAHKMRSYVITNFENSNRCELISNYKKQ